MYIIHLYIHVYMRVWGGEVIHYKLGGHNFVALAANGVSITPTYIE